MNLSDQLRRRAGSLQWVGDNSPAFLMIEAADRLDELEELKSRHDHPAGKHVGPWSEEGQESATLNDLRALSTQMHELVAKAVIQGQKEHKAFDERLRKLKPQPSVKFRNT